MIVKLGRKFKEYIDNFNDELLVTVFDMKTGLTLASLEVKELKEKKYFDDYTVMHFINFNKNIVLIGIMGEATDDTNSKKIS